MYFILLLIIETVDFYPVPSQPSRVCVCVCVWPGARLCVRRTEYGRQSGALRQFQAFIFLIYKRQALCAPTSPPLPRQGNRGGIIASEVQKYRVAIWEEDEKKRKREKEQKASVRMKRAGKEFQTGSFTPATGTQRLRHCDKRQSKCICKCKRLLSLLKHCAGFFPALEA